MIGKVAVSVISAIVVVGVIIAAVSISPGKEGNHGDSSMSSSMKAVSSICAATDYKDACLNSMESVTKNGSATTKDYIQAAVQAAMEEIKSSMNASGDLAQVSNKSMTHMALDDCKELLEFAIDELQESLASVKGTDLQSLSLRGEEILNWLSAVVSYQQTCIDGIIEPKVQAAIQTVLNNATQLTSNALAIVSDLGKILNSMKAIPVDLKLNSRRLLGEIEVGRDGYPAWFSAADRKLLAFQDAGRLKPDAVVAKDGSGQFTTIAAALAAYPKNLNGSRYVIYVKAGIYREYITITKDQVNVYMYGDGPRKTIVTGSKSFRDGITTYKTATFSAVGKGFVARSMGFANTAGPDGHQAVALRVQADMAAIFNCRIDGYQDSLYVQAHRQFYRNCVVSGTIDFIFGDSTTVIQNSLIIVRRPNDNQKNTVTAHGKSDKRETTGLVIHNCRIVPEQRLFPDRMTMPSYLGRPWKAYSKTIVMESTLGDLIQPEGWLPWAGDFALDTLFYAEYGNRGPGANTTNRVKWKGYRVITDRNEALQFTVPTFIQGDLWLEPLNVPYMSGLRR